MREIVFDEIERVLDLHFTNDVMKGQLKLFMQEKVEEGSIWADLTCYTHLMLNGDNPHIERISAWTEMIMLALDIIDDLQDQDNNTKKWMQYPAEYALNATLSFIFAALHELGELQESLRSHAVPLTSMISQLLLNSGHGQFVDIAHSVETEEDYIMMIRQKSGSLIRLACYMGYACIDQCDPHVIRTMDELAEVIGVVLQLENDIRDVQRYDIKNDLLHKKRTLPVLFLLQHSEEEFPDFIKYYEGNLSEQEFTSKKTACLQYIADSGCIEYSKVIQKLFVHRAEQLLNELPTISPWKEKFRELTLASYGMGMTENERMDGEVDVVVR